MTDFRKVLATTAVSALALMGCRDAATSDADAADARPETVVGDTVAARAEPTLRNDQLLDEPFIYSVTDADSEVILYPTIHALPDGVEWKTPALEAAMARADEIWFELAPGALTDPATQTAFMEMSMDGTPLSERLSEEQYAELGEDLEAAGIPAAALEPFEPWMAAVSLTQIQMMKAGFSPELGVETQLEAMIGDRPSRGLETVRKQLGYFDTLDEDAQIDFLLQGAGELDEAIELLNKLSVAWAEGDVEFIETEVVNAMRDDTPAVYDALLVQRNADWAEQLDAELQGEGVDFVAVGAAHLIGADSVPAMLAQRGYDVKLLTLQE